jgi:LmbE family N-acetylglucosaminyl deacetylase
MLVLVFGVALVAIALRTPNAFDDPPRHMLICAAHSDDCVIMGAEYAYGAIQKGLSIKIVYLTCSGPHPNSEISQTRKAEALAAWLSQGVSEDNFVFINLRESPVRGPLSYSNKDITQAMDVLTKVMVGLPRDAAVIVPARGESHVDHRTIRQISLQAVESSRRQDLIVYETPEYNSFLSLLYCPRKTIRAILCHIPLFGRFIPPFVGPSNFINGSLGSIFRDTPARLAEKKRMLSYFSSQDAVLLARIFGHETRYRRWSASDNLRASEGMCYPAFGGCCDRSALFFGFVLAVTIFLTAEQFARGLVTAFSPASDLAIFIISFGGILAVIYLVRILRRMTSLETLMFAWATAFGLIFGPLSGS